MNSELRKFFALNALSYKSEKDALVLKGNYKIRSLLELADVLYELDDQVFSYHIRNNTNDFSKWIEENIKDYKLSQTIYHIKNKKTMSHVVNVRISQLSNMAKKDFNSSLIKIKTPSVMDFHSSLKKVINN